MKKNAIKMAIETNGCSETTTVYFLLISKKCNEPNNNLAINYENKTNSAILIEINTNTKL